MKELSKYIDNHINKSVISKHVIDETIDDFISDNRIINVTDDAVERFICCNWSGTDEYNDVIIKRDYNTYQQLLVRETLNDSYDHNTLIYFINKYWGDDVVGDYIDNESDSDTHKITINLKRNIIGDDKFNEIIHFMNYFVKYNKKVNNHYTLVLEPFKPSNQTNFIYNVCNGVVYHITFEKYYNSIIRGGGLKPKRLNKSELNDENIEHLLYRPSRVYVVSGKNVKTNVERIVNQTASMNTHKDAGKQVILKVDLNSYYKDHGFKLNFYADPANPKNSSTFFTYEFIPKKYINKVQLNEIT